MKCWNWWSLTMIMKFNKSPSKCRRWKKEIIEIFYPFKFTLGGWKDWRQSRYMGLTWHLWTLHSDPHTQTNRDWDDFRLKGMGAGGIRQREGKSLSGCWIDLRRQFLEPPGSWGQRCFRVKNHFLKGLCRVHPMLHFSMYHKVKLPSLFTCSYSSVVPPLSLLSSQDSFHPT